MKLSERMGATWRRKMFEWKTGDFFGDEWANEVAELEEDNDALKRENDSWQKAFDYICDDSLEEVLADRKERIDALAAIRDNASLR